MVVVCTHSRASFASAKPAIGPALTFLGVSAYWERAIQGAIILIAVAADGIRHPLFRRPVGQVAGA